MKIEYTKPLESLRSAWLGLGVTLYLFAGNALAELPSSAEDVLPDGIGVDRPTDAMLGIFSWAIQALSYILMAGAVLGGGYFIFRAFGEASDTKGGWGKFGGVAVGSIIMVGIVVTMGLIAVNWAQGLADGVTVGTAG